MKRLFTILTILIVAAGCGEKQNSIYGEYQGFWAETLWVINLNPNDSFEFKIQGHMDDTIITGSFKRSNDTLTLNKNNYLEEKKFLVLEDSCIIELEPPFYDYCKIREYPWASREWDINTLQIIKEFPN